MLSRELAEEVIKELLARSGKLDKSVDILQGAWRFPARNGSSTPPGALPAPSTVLLS